MYCRVEVRSRRCFFVELNSTGVFQKRPRVFLPPARLRAGGRNKRGLKALSKNGAFFFCPAGFPPAVPFVENPPPGFTFRAVLIAWPSSKAYNRTGSTRLPGRRRPARRKARFLPIFRYFCIAIVCAKFGRNFHPRTVFARLPRPRALQFVYGYSTVETVENSVETVKNSPVFPNCIILGRPGRHLPSTKR